MKSIREMALRDSEPIDVVTEYILKSSFPEQVDNTIENCRKDLLQRTSSADSITTYQGMKFATHMGNI